MYNNIIPKLNNVKLKIVNNISNSIFWNGSVAGKIYYDVSQGYEIEHLRILKYESY